MYPTTALCFVAATSATWTGSGPKGTYSQSSGLYAFRQARSTGLCIGVAASSRATRPQACVAATSHDRVSKKAGQNLDGSEIGAGSFSQDRNPVKTSWIRNRIGVF